ncbi:MAG: hypothetical protein M3O87_04105 [Candidatus Dormibacteraeota bacterium]|nr:hypothetical protein [Candidatus Dormibacteraeota bacterium]
MQPLAVGGYTAAAVQAQLAASAQEDWAFDHLGPDGRYIKDLGLYLDKGSVPQVVHDSSAAIKRSLQISLRGDCGVKPLQDLVRPHYRLRMPDGGWADWALGTFLMMLPDKRISAGATWWQCALPELLQLLTDAGLPQTVAIPAGSTVLAGISLLLATANAVLATPLALLYTTPPTAVLPASIGANLGDAPHKAINDLLRGSAYQTLWADESQPLPLLRTDPIPDYNTVPPLFVFDATVASNVVGEFQETTDVSKIFNDQWVVGEDPRTKTPVVGHYTNINPLSPYSVGNWHLKTAPTIRDSAIPDVASANARARAEVQAAARIGAVLKMSTFAWPASEDRDVYRVTYNTSDEGLRSDLFLETRWTHPCAAGALTQHELERVTPA